jgi:hypothetical protein
MTTQMRAIRSKSKHVPTTNGETAVEENQGVRAGATLNRGE